jgi:hypothetical protein
MRFCSGQAGAEFALFARLYATGRTTHRQRILRFDFHTHTMRDKSPTAWSLVTIAQSLRVSVFFVAKSILPGSAGLSRTVVSHSLTMLAQRPSIGMERVTSSLLFQVL